MLQPKQIRNFWAYTYTSIFVRMENVKRKATWSTSKCNTKSRIRPQTAGNRWKHHGINERGWVGLEAAKSGKVFNDYEKAGTNFLQIFNFHVNSRW